MTPPMRPVLLRAAGTMALCAALALIDIDRWAVRWDIALLAVAVLVGWIPGLLCVAVAGASHLARHHDADAFSTFVVFAVGGLLTGWALRRPAIPGATPRRAALVYLRLVPIVATAAAAQTLVQTSGFPARVWGTELLHTAVGISAAALVAHLPLPSRRGPSLWGPSLSMLLTLLLLVSTVGFWDRQDTKALTSTVAAAALSFNVDITDESNVLTTKAGTHAEFPFDASSFAGQLQTVVFGHEPITAAALIDYLPGRGVITEAAISDYGTVYESAFSAWLNALGGPDFHRLATDGTTVFLGMASFPVPSPDENESVPPHPAFVYAAPLVGQDGFDPTHPRLLAITISVPLLMSRALALATTPTNEVAAVLDEVSSGTPRQVWETVSTATRAAFGSVSGVSAVSSARKTAYNDLSVDALQFKLVLARGSRFGTPLATRRLLSALELLVGLAAFAGSLLLSHDRARRERERLRREALLRTALEGAPGWTAIIDEYDDVLVGNNDPGGAPIGSRLQDAAIWRNDPVSGQRVADAVQGARSGTAESMTLTPKHDDHPDHPIRIFEVLVHRIETETADSLVFLQCVDVTARRELAMRTAQSERMESIGVLAGSLAHDFNNLLFITQGYLQMMERQPIVANDPQLNRFVTKAADAVQRGATIAKSLLAVARSQPMANVPISMNQFMLDLDPLLQQSFKDSPNITLHKEIIGDQLDVVVDPGRLSSAVLNLVFNARDAMETGGSITVRAERTIATDTTGETREVIALQVHDTGKGMSPEVAARAYEPFFTTGKMGKGTGLGLAAVYSFAQQSGGWTTIESREGIGTTVSIFLIPAIAAPAVAGPTAPQIGEEKLRAVVVDDEESLAELVAGWLIDLGFDTRTAANSQDARAVTAEFRPHLLLSDANLGEDIDGAELASQLTKSMPTLTTVFMTGFSDRLRALETVGAMTLAKPFSRDDLRAALTKVLGARLPGTTSPADSAP